MPLRSWHAVLLGLVFTPLLVAADKNKQELPEPLTLDYALSLSQEAHPSLLAYQYQIDAQLANRQRAEAADDYSASLVGRVRWIDVPLYTPSPGINEDHSVGLSIKKPLLDSGQSVNKSRAAQLMERSARAKYQAALNKRQQLIARRYFDTVLADLKSLYANERLASGFIRWDRARTRQKLGQAEELEVLRLDREYQAIRRERTIVENLQRTTRGRLAEAMNRPDTLPATLIVPQLPQLKRKRPPLELIQSLARQHNPELRALRHEVAAKEAELVAARARDGLSVDAELLFNSYTFQPSGRDNLRAGINFSYPLSRGGRSNADIALAMSNKHQAQSRLEGTRNRINQALLEAWMRLDAQKIERQEMRALLDYSEFYLDRTRIKYEQGLQTTLGDSMQGIANSEWRMTQTDFSMAMTWLELEGLVGLPYEQFPQQQNK